MNPTAGGNPQTEPFSEQTTTMIVFPLGAVVRMATAVHVGQMLVITNLKSRQDAICRVIKVRSFPNLQSYVEVEFTQPQPRYWNVYFSAERTAGGQVPGIGSPGVVSPQAQAKPMVTPEVVRVPNQPASAPKPIEDASAHEVSAARPGAAPVPPQVKPVPSPAPVSLQTATKIEPASSALPQAISPQRLNEGPSYAAPPRRGEIAVPLPMLPLPEPKAEKAEVELLAEAVEANQKGNHALSVAEIPVSAGRGFGALGIAVERPAEHQADFVESIRQPFGDTAIGRERGGRQDRTLVLAAAAVLLMAVVGGVWYFHPSSRSSSPAATSSYDSSASQPTNSGSTQASSTALPAATTVATPVSQSTGTNLDALSPSGAPPSNALANATRREATPKSDPAGIESQPAVNASAPVASTPKNVFNPKVMKARPLLSLRKTDSHSQAPILDPTAVAANQPGELSGIVPLNPSLPAPTPAGPVQAGGLVKEPKLISSTRPTYPAMAKQARVEGDVVIDTLLDKNGNVSRAKVVSGPTMLREAALEALRGWKFEPSRLDGQPVEVEMLVTIKFRL